MFSVPFTEDTLIFSFFPAVTAEDGKGALIQRKEGTHLLIRPMLIEDYDAVYHLWSDTPGMGMRSLDDSLEGIARFLTRNPNSCFVAESEHQIAGVILCGQDGRRGYIYHTAVKQDCRKRGIGKALVDAALEALQKEKINKVALVVFTTNHLGNEFWERIGFTMRDDLIYRNFSLSTENT
jgi:N-acetylglutamate synthase